jgi:NADH-quinone oxidoreductase subunit M
VAGALLHAMSVIAAVAGLVLLAASIQARTGTTDMRRLGGLHRRTRRLSLGFLLLCAAAVGFPGSVGFVSDDLMIQGLLRGHAVAVVCMLVATALNGITLFRAFKRTFLGPPAIHADDLSAIADSLPRERWVSSTLILALLISGFAPAPLLAIRHSVVTALSPRSGGTAPPSRTGLLP